MTERFAGPSTVVIAPPGGPTQRITKAPPRTTLDSKRIPLIDAQEVALNDELIVLDEGTRIRNREFKRRMDAIEGRESEWRRRLEEEEAEKDREHSKVFEGIR